MLLDGALVPLASERVGEVARYHNWDVHEPVEWWLLGLLLAAVWREDWIVARATPAVQRPRIARHRGDQTTMQKSARRADPPEPCAGGTNWLCNAASFAAVSLLAPRQQWWMFLVESLVQGVCLVRAPKGCVCKRLQPFRCCYRTSCLSSANVSLLQLSFACHI